MILPAIRYRGRARPPMRGSTESRGLGFLIQRPAPDN
jgi:hypothetical protein